MSSVPKCDRTLSDQIDGQTTRGYSVSHKSNKSGASIPSQPRHVSCVTSANMRLGPGHLIR